MSAKIWGTAIAAIFLVGIASAQIIADDPLIVNALSVDPAAEEVLNGFFLPADVITPTGPGVPNVLFPFEGLALTPADDLNALHLYPPLSPAPSGSFALFFSVDRNSLGARAPESSLASDGYVFNVRSQALRRQAAGDWFVSLLLYNGEGPLPAGRIPASNNLLVVNSGDAGGISNQLDPNSLPPTDENTGTQTEKDAGSATGARTVTTARGLQSFVHFSLRAGSPSLMTLPGTPSPGNIYVDNAPFAPGGESLFLNANSIGLRPGDDLDALYIFERGDAPGVFEPLSDFLLFSLTPDSTSVVDFGESPADILISIGFGQFAVFVSADQLGLRAIDNVDALDILPCDDIETCARAWGLRLAPPPCVGDLDGSDIVSGADLNLLLSRFNTCFPSPAYDPTADLNSSGCVEGGDLNLLLTNFGPCP